MSLEQITDRRKLTVLGLNSGTSIDALDLAAMRISRISGKPSLHFLAGATRKIPEKTRNLLLDLVSSETCRLEDIIYADNLLGRQWGRVAALYIRKLRHDGLRVNVVASHGQTVRHMPVGRNLASLNLKGTLQLGSLDMIAAATALPVVGNFRQADIALGGEGAPITTGAMARLFQHDRESRLIVNIGGMANYFYLPARRSLPAVRAADCGPGNSLSDILAGRLFGVPFDRNGGLAAAGTVSQRLLATLRTDSFFRSKAVSTGREAFGERMVDDMIRHGQCLRLKKEDLLSTAAELTVVSIVAGIRSILKQDRKLSKLYLTGGGRRNKFFVRQLKDRLPDLVILSIDELGINGDNVEAASYAVMGEACLRSESLGAERSGAERQPVTGHIVQPPLTRNKGKRT